MLTTRQASAVYLKTLRSIYLEPSPDEPPHPSLDLLRAKGIPTVSDRQFYQALKPVTKRRRLLLALVHHDDWTWNAIAFSKTTNRASSLDDRVMH